MSWEHRNGLEVGVGSRLELPDVAVSLKARKKVDVEEQGVSVEEKLDQTKEQL